MAPTICETSRPEWRCSRACCWDEGFPGARGRRQRRRRHGGVIGSRQELFAQLLFGVRGLSAAVADKKA